MATKAPEASNRATGATAQEKRRQTLERKKLQEQAQLRALELAGKQKRVALTKALGNAAWIGAAPVGSQKRPRSPNGPQGGETAKKAKRLPLPNARSTATMQTVTPQRPLAKKQAHLPPSHCRTPNDENYPDQRHVRSASVSASKRLHKRDDNNPDQRHVRSTSTSASKRSYKPTTYRVVNSSDEESPEQEEDMDASQPEVDEHEDEDEEAGQDDLEELDSDALKSTFTHERVRWGREHLTNGEAEPDGDDDYEETDPHNDRHDDGEGEEEAGDDDDDDDDEEEEEEEMTKVQKKIGKHGLERRAELPTWKTPTVAATNDDEEPFDSANSDDDMDDEEGEDQNEGENVDPNANWENARYVPEAPGTWLISIRMQPPALRQIIRAAIRQVVGDAIFDNAYPPASDELTYFRKTLRSCARKLKHTGYAERFKIDLQFGIVVARVLNGRLSTYCSSIKKKTGGKVEGFYQLTKGLECQKQVKALCEDTSYIFPTKDGEIVSNKPFHHPALISTLHDVYFSGTHGTYAERFSARFGSSIMEGPRKYEQELPAPMVALAATGVHSSLDDFSTGIHQKTEFAADLYEDIYIGHITFLNNIKTESPDRYHRLMANLFKLASVVSTRRSTALTNNAMALLNLADMEV